MKKKTGWLGDGNMGKGGDSVGPYILRIRPQGRFGYCKMCAAKVKEGKKKKVIKRKLLYDPVFKAHWCNTCLKEIYKGSSLRNKEEKKKFSKFLRGRRARFARDRQKDHSGLRGVLKT